MHQVIRSSGRVSTVTGWLLISVAAVATVVFLVLPIALGETWLLTFLFAPVMLVAGGFLNLWMGRRARLEIQADRFIWCGFVSSPHSLEWHDVWQILMPPPNASRRLAAVAQLQDGRFVEVRALWQSPTSPFALLSTPDFSRAQRALVDGHRAYLARFAQL